MPDTLTVLGIESSCDETAVAVLRSSGEEEAPDILSSVISSQIAIHRQHGGVVPELASRNHSADLPGVIRSACREAGVTPADIDVFGATAGPGLVAALLVGNSTAKALALATGKPFVSVNHLEGHLLSPFVKRPKGPVPHLGMVVSGGHTLFVDVRGVGDYRLLGRSLDDAAGEAFDKVGKMLGLPYPGGPEIDRRAKEGRAVIRFCPNLHARGDLAYSFSGLKTAVVNYVHNLTQRGEEIPVNDVCASFTAEAVGYLVDTFMECVRRRGVKSAALAGGVAANSYLRARLGEACAAEGVKLFVPPPVLCTDNAAMIAARGYFSFAGGRDIADLSLNAVSNL